MSEGSDIVQLEGATRAFAGTKAVDALSVKLKAGVVMGFLGFAQAYLDEMAKRGARQ